MGDAIEHRLQEAFGAHVRSEGPLAPGGAGFRITGVDLGKSLEPDQANALIDALSHYRIMTLADQDLDAFSAAHFERFANHWGAPLPHPSNFKRLGNTRYYKPELLPPEERPSTRVNAAFPHELRCLPGADSPAVFVVTNVRDLTHEERRAGPRLLPATTWHTDIEHHAIPLHVSMFLVHKAPVARDAPGGTWVPEWVPGPDDSQTDRYFEDSDPELLRLRRSLPLNGETSFADTAAAFAALPGADQARLSKIRVRRHSYTRNDGANLAPLVRTNPRSGIKSLHSPLWCPRPPTQIPLEVEGMSEEASRAFLEEIEAHVLQPEFRYDRAHTPGDVTLWDLFMTLHVAPPSKDNIQSLDDARLFYRISCKGEPALTLPRHDSPEWVREHIFLEYTTPMAVVQAS